MSRGELYRMDPRGDPEVAVSSLEVAVDAVFADDILGLADIVVVAVAVDMLVDIVLAVVGNIAVRKILVAADTEDAKFAAVAAEEAVEHICFRAVRSSHLRARLEILDCYRTLYAAVDNSAAERWTAVVVVVAMVLEVFRSGIAAFAMALFEIESAWVAHSHFGIVKEKHIVDLEAAHEVREAMAGHPLLHSVKMFWVDMNLSILRQALAAAVAVYLHPASPLPRDCPFSAWAVTLALLEHPAVVVVVVAIVLSASDIAVAVPY